MLEIVEAATFMADHLVLDRRRTVGLPTTAIGSIDSSDAA
jgi:hypothetical protein